MLYFPYILPKTIQIVGNLGLWVIWPPTHPRLWLFPGLFVVNSRVTDTWRKSTGSMIDCSIDCSRLFDWLKQIFPIIDCKSQEEIIYILAFLAFFGHCIQRANVQRFQPLFHESDLAPLFHPLWTLSVKETTLSGSKWWLKMSERGSNHAPMLDIQVGQKKFTFPAKEVTFPATFVNSFILLFHC